VAGHAGGRRSARRMGGSPSPAEPSGPDGGLGGRGGRASALWGDRRRVPSGSPRARWGDPGPGSRARPSALRALGHSTDDQPGLRRCPGAAAHAGAQGGPAAGGDRPPAGARLLPERRHGAGHRARAVRASGKTGGRRRPGGCDGEHGTGCTGRTCGVGRTVRAGVPDPAGCAPGAPADRRLDPAGTSGGGPNSDRPGGVLSCQTRFG